MYPPFAGGLLVRRREFFVQKILIKVLTNDYYSDIIIACERELLIDV